MSIKPYAGLILTHKSGARCKIHKFCEKTKRWVVLFSSQSNGSSETMMRLTDNSISEEFILSEDQIYFNFPYHMERWQFLNK